MTTLHKTIIILITLLALTGAAFAASHEDASAMKGHDASAMKGGDRIGELFHESMVDGYMLSYYLMDMRAQKKEDAAAHGSHGEKEMEKPHHIMVYIMDKDHKVVEKAKVGFLIKGGVKESQKIMGMYMSKGFGITADMKAKGTYTIVTKAMIGDTKIMDKFDYEMK
ncbi:MAG: hypothetical protein MI863_08810 [Desulfobacterales bacterium]|nr:hypothetical protein [Desulfobacterales bacterium]